MSIQSALFGTAEPTPEPAIDRKEYYSIGTHDALLLKKAHLPGWMKHTAAAPPAPAPTEAAKGSE